MKQNVSWKKNNATEVYIFQNGMFNKFYYIHSSMIGYMMIYITFIYMNLNSYINFSETVDLDA
jgi:hypothetical protein